MAASNPMHLDLDITVISAKHLKNVNWRYGDLKPYVVLYLDPDHRLSTRSEDSGSKKPVWNERFKIPLTRSIHESVLTLEIFHSKVSDFFKTLVGSVRFTLSHLVDSGESLVPESIHTLELVRPSGRPQGKIRLKLAIKEQPFAPPPQSPLRPQSQPQEYLYNPKGSYYYSSAPPPPPPPAPMMDSSPARDYREFPPSPYPCDNFFPGHYYASLPPPSRSIYDRASNYGLRGSSSAPVDFFQSNDHKPQTPHPSPSLSRLSSFCPPSGPSAPVDAFPSYDHRPPPASVVSLLFNYGRRSRPSAPVDYSPYDPGHFQQRMGGLSIEEERITADRAASELAARAPYGYGSNYHREC